MFTGREDPLTFLGNEFRAGTYMQELIKNLLQKIGEDPTRKGLVKTPERVAKSWQFLTQGYQQNIKNILNGALFASAHDDMIVIKDIEVFSLCEHHLLPFFGKCHIGYIPSGKVIGISKLARLVDAFAHRLQIQENLTHQIAEAIMKNLKPAGVGVVIEAQHLCMMMRGVEKQNSKMITSSMLGNFRESQKTREEFLNFRA